MSDKNKVFWESSLIRENGSTYAIPKKYADEPKMCSKTDKYRLKKIEERILMGKNGEKVYTIRDNGSMQVSLSKPSKAFGFEEIYKMG